MSYYNLYYPQTPSIAGPHDLSYVACKNAKFTIKLSATRHAALGKCGESRRSNTLTVIVCFVELKLVFLANCLYSPCTCICPTYMYINSPNYDVYIFGFS